MDAHRPISVEQLVSRFGTQQAMFVLQRIGEDGCFHVLKEGRLEQFKLRRHFQLVEEVELI